jgi:hypothetical protein
MAGFRNNIRKKRDRSSASPQEENEKQADNENHDCSRPQEPSPLRTVTTDDHRNQTTRAA